MSELPIRPAVVYFAIRDVEYPRNSRLRSHLMGCGFDVRPVPAAVGRNRLVKLATNIAHLWKESRQAKVVVLSEFSLPYAIVTWAVARSVGAIHVVDGFIGLHETEIEDRHNASARSLKARVYRLIDLIARKFADVFLIDTEVRAAAVRPFIRRNATALSLPVGAPPWATPVKSDTEVPPLRVLYYGNHVPLHGLEFVVAAVASLPSNLHVQLTLVGDVAKSSHLVKTNAGGVEERFIIRPPVAPEELRAVIAEHQVVLGVFGESIKAEGVIANKVWQGLSCDRLVVTRHSRALSEIEPLVGEKLLTVSPGSPADIASALTQVSMSYRPDHDAGIANRLEAYVTQRFDLLIGELERRGVRAMSTSADAGRK
ncbi:glycosyltransferase involved in cell wall biosynthesis [Labedella gwakjiensis]|uniref:Glycosyltransferase n=1 Tax=Labedella gwakjiensis TaxID=390269 RepID=A0A2P8GY74_9MICO|nr:glycosyltransferase [Labedella gwakjiensis]PSL38920.1 glycosyltransferase involved in cell wall biosynthesis [Labedella gwakjiensis]RUQ86617.1 glycosyltransferase [Labedella gwakjiensis]